MKKAAHKNSSAKASTQKVHKTRTVKSSTFKHKKLLLTIAAVLLVLFVLPPTRQPMANALAQTGLFKGSATVTWPAIEGAKTYNIYYKRVGSKSGDNYAHAVREIPADQTSYTITGLKKGKTYEYKISAVNEEGEEFMWTSFEPTSEAN